MDLEKTPVSSATFDAIICIHVLEHVEDDYSAICELFRVLKPNGWALITVPIRLDHKTYEDSTITSPEDRLKAFGETSHYRFYGYDFIERLEASGFQVQVDLGKNLDTQMMTKYGLLDDENVFLCRKNKASCNVLES